MERELLKQIPMSDKPNSAATVRFPNLSEDDLNDLAGQRTSSNTKEQTKWAIKIFRGEL